MNPIDPTANPTFRRILGNRQSPLRQLLLRTQSLSELEQRVLPCIPELLRPHVMIAGIQDGRLLLITSGGAWATRIRQLQDSIVAELRRQAPEYGVQAVSIKVRPMAQAPHKAKRPARLLSKENARLLVEEAEHTKDEGLKRVLLALASHQRED